ncbi:MAG TPA: C13 family peptidase [Steroidobacteraceae bacterium]|nr:C13 family peptidase [Steroidobacteraceae bacterium]
MPRLRQAALRVACSLALCLATLASGIPRLAQAATEHAAATQQQQRIAQAVAHMAPRRSGVANVFFVGFAGYGEQRVFRKEAELAERVFAEHFGSGARSLELVNDVHDRHSYPLATLQNLRYALELIAARMDRGEDVLMLVLTSHGSREDGIALTNGKLVDDALAPEDLRAALDHAGIRWRVVVASACYAGIFIPPLKSDSTLVMTAADARHSSFGCADDRDLTYFGEALFQDALTRTCSLEDAFVDARGIIRRRETAEGEIHSNPQLYVGAGMHAKLQGLPEARACSARGPERSG